MVGCDRLNVPAMDTFSRSSLEVQKQPHVSPPCSGCSATMCVMYVVPGEQEIRRLTAPVSTSGLLRVAHLCLVVTSSLVVRDGIVEGAEHAADGCVRFTFGTSGHSAWSVSNHTVYGLHPLDIYLPPPPPPRPSTLPPDLGDCIVRIVQALPTDRNKKPKKLFSQPRSLSVYD